MQLYHEAEINFREHPAPVFELELYAGTPENPHQLPGEASGHDKAVAVLLQVAELPGGSASWRSRAFRFLPTSG